MSHSFTTGKTRYRENRCTLVRSLIMLLVGSIISQFLSPLSSYAAAADSPSDPNNNANEQRGLTAITFGVKAGFSLSQHSGVEERDAEYEVSSEWRKGGGVGVFLYLPITRRFGLQQEVLYVQKGSRQNITVDILDIPCRFQKCRPPCHF